MKLSAFAAPIALLGALVVLLVRNTNRASVVPMKSAGYEVHVTKPKPLDPVVTPNDEIDYSPLGELLLNRSSHSRKQFLYLTQTKNFKPQWKFYLLSFVNDNSDVMCLAAYPPFGPCVDGKGATWTVGRNVLWKEAGQLSHKYLYYVFMDEDITFVRKSNISGFQEALLRVRPAVASPIVLPSSRFFWNSIIMKQARTQLESVRAFDAQIVAFHRDVFFNGFLLPHYSATDFWSWTLSQFWLLAIGQRVYPTDMAQMNGIWITNTNHSEYPKGQQHLNWFDYAGLYNREFEIATVYHPKVHELIVPRENYTVNPATVMRKNSGYWCAIEMFKKDPHVKSLMPCVSRNELQKYAPVTFRGRSPVPITPLRALQLPSCRLIVEDDVVSRALATHYSCPTSFPVTEATCEDSEPLYQGTIFGSPQLGEYAIVEGAVHVRLYCPAISHSINTTFPTRVCTARVGNSVGCPRLPRVQSAWTPFMDVGANETIAIPMAATVKFLVMACPVRVEIFPIGSIYKYNFIFPILATEADPAKARRKTPQRGNVILIEMDGISNSRFSEHFTKVGGLVVDGFRQWSSSSYQGIRNVQLLCMSKAIPQKFCGKSYGKHRSLRVGAYIVAQSLYSGKYGGTKYFNLSKVDYSQDMDELLRFRDGPLNDQLCPFRVDLPPPYSCWGSKPIYEYQFDYVREAITVNKGKNVFSYIKLPTDTQYSHHYEYIDYYMEKFLKEVLQNGPTSVVIYSTYTTIKRNDKPEVGEYPGIGTLRLIVPNGSAVSIDTKATHTIEDIREIVSELISPPSAEPKPRALLAQTAVVADPPVEYRGNPAEVVLSCSEAFQVMMNSLLSAYTCSVNSTYEGTSLGIDSKLITPGIYRVLLTIGTAYVSALFYSSPIKCDIEWFSERSHDCRFECLPSTPFVVSSHCDCGGYS